jgi:hypothetical protein
MPAQKVEQPKGSSTSAAPLRKPWKKKTPVDIVFDQITKLKREIAETDDEQKERRRQLAKFEEAKKLFES